MEEDDPEILSNIETLIDWTDLVKMEEDDPEILSNIETLIDWTGLVEMEVDDREIILSNIETLIDWADYDKLKGRCISKNKLSRDTLNKIENSSNEKKLWHRQLLEEITETSDITDLVDIYESLNFWDAADFLSSFKKKDMFAEHQFLRNSTHPVRRVERDGNILGSSSRRNSIEDIPLQLFTEDIPETLKVVKAVQFCSSRILSYPMRSKNRGVLFLVNIINIKDKPSLYRNGAIVDKHRLISLFKQFGFEIFYYEDLTLNEFQHLVDQLIASKYLRKTDCLVFCVLSHGCFSYGHQMIQFSDGESGSIEDVIVKFSNRSCPYLRRKPKLFIFPMCRGISNKIKVKTFDAPNANLQHDNIPAFSDIKICYGSVKGFETFRDQKNGSWYIRTFCEILASFAYNEHFDDMHKLIGQRLESYCQSQSNGNENFVQTISSEDLGFTQNLFFNPGYYGERAE